MARQGEDRGRCTDAKRLEMTGRVDADMQIGQCYHLIGVGPSVATPQYDAVIPGEKAIKWTAAGFVTRMQPHIELQWSRIDLQERVDKFDRTLRRYASLRRQRQDGFFRVRNKAGLPQRARRVDQGRADSPYSTEPTKRSITRLLCPIVPIYGENIRQQQRPAVAVERVSGKIVGMAVAENSMLHLDKGNPKAVRREKQRELTGVWNQQRFRVQALEHEAVEFRSPLQHAELLPNPLRREIGKRKIAHDPFGEPSERRIV